MTQSNYDSLGQGLKVYTDAMRRFLKEQLIAAFPNGWWEQGVLPTLSESQRRNISRDAENDPSRDKVDLLDPAHFVPCSDTQLRPSLRRRLPQLQANPGLAAPSGARSD